MDIGVERPVTLYVFKSMGLPRRGPTVMDGGSMTSSLFRHHSNRRRRGGQVYKGP